MSTLSDQIGNQVDAGRKTIERSFAEIKELDVRQMPPAVYVAGAVMAAAIVAGALWVVYRNRRRRTLAQRLSETLPDGVRDLPGEVRARVKRVL